MSAQPPINSKAILICPACGRNRKRKGKKGYHCTYCRYHRRRAREMANKEPVARRRYADGEIPPCSRCGSARRRRGEKQKIFCPRCCNKAKLLREQKGRPPRKDRPLGCALHPRGRDSQCAHCRQAYYLVNRSRVLAQVGAYRLRNLEDLRSKDREKARRERQEISDGYVKLQLTKNSILSFSDIPPDLVALKRAKIRLSRELSKHKTTHK